LILGLMKLKKLKTRGRGNKMEDRIAFNEIEAPYREFRPSPFAGPCAFPIPPRERGSVEIRLTRLTSRTPNVNYGDKQ
jgi:hypothetical protein